MCKKKMHKWESSIIYVQLIRFEDISYMKMQNAGVCGQERLGLPFIEYKQVHLGN